MNPARRIIGKFGGLRPLAYLIDYPVSTVQHWQDSGFIPTRHGGIVMAAARHIGVPLDGEEFFDIPDALPFVQHHQRGTATNG